MIRALLSLAAMGGLAAAPLPASAQAAPVAQTAIDPARLAAAQQLLDIMLPPAQREAMVEGMIRPMMANMRQSMQQVPVLSEAIGKDPKIAEVFDHFLSQQEERSVETLRQGMPGMMEAMARAYARRFDLQQLGDIRAFFETPTGKVYMAAAYTIMSDPDILTWQRDLMSRSLMHAQEDIGKFIADLPAPSASGHSQ